MRSPLTLGQQPHLLPFMVPKLRLYFIPFLMVLVLLLLVLMLV